MGIFGRKKNQQAEISFPAEIGSPVAGTVVPMADIPDPTFSQGMLGVCCGVEPDEEVVCAPIDGRISQLADTMHAVGIEAGGMEILIHLGVDTVDMEGDGFKARTKEGRTVSKGDPLVQVDFERVRGAGHPTTVIMAVTNSDDFGNVEAVGDGHVACGDLLLKVSKT